MRFGHPVVCGLVGAHEFANELPTGTTKAEGQRSKVLIVGSDVRQSEKAIARSASILRHRDMD